MPARPETFISRDREMEFPLHIDVAKRHGCDVREIVGRISAGLRSTALCRESVFQVMAMLVSKVSLSFVRSKEK